MRMASRYGHAWVSQYGAAPDGIAAAEWRGTLAGITSAQIRRGFADDAVRGSDWPPSSTRFRAMCLDIPTLAEVSMRFRKHQSRTAFDRLVYLYLDSYRFKNSAWDKADRLLRDAYEMARNHIISGGELPPEPVADIGFEKPIHKPASPEEVKPYMDAIAEMLKTEPVKPHTEVDHESAD